MILSTILYILVCVLLVVIVLLQQGKGAGLGIIGGSSDTILGSNAGNVFTKTTSFLAFLFILGALTLSVLGSGERSTIDRETDKPATEETTLDGGIITPGTRTPGEIGTPSEDDSPGASTLSQ